MSELDLRTPGERALLEVQAARALLQITSGHQRTSEAVLRACGTLRVKQPALAASILVQEALRHPPHRRLEWLEYAKEMLDEHGMGPDVDRAGILEAYDHIALLIEGSKADIARRERWLGDMITASIVLLAATLLTMIGSKIMDWACAGPSQDAPAAQAEHPTNKEPAKPSGAESK